jgi:hypothetical protein
MNNKLTELKDELNFIKFKRTFLLEFTRQLIRHSSHADILKLQTILEKERRIPEKEKPLTEKEKLKERIKKRGEDQDEKIEGERSIMHPSIGMFESQKDSELNPFVNTFRKERPAEVRQPEQFKKTVYRNEQFTENPVRQIRTPPQDPFRKIELWIPEPRLPPHIQYLKPTPVNKYIELGKLGPMINDPMVKIIECYGPDQNIGVKGGMGERKTGIILNKDEIDKVIDKFSKETKIPVQEGIFKVVSGRLILLAVISGVTGTKFTITKMSQEEINQRV